MEPKSRHHTCVVAGHARVQGWPQIPRLSCKSVASKLAPIGAGRLACSTARLFSWLRCAVLARAGFAWRAGFLFDGDGSVPFGLIAARAGGLVQLGDHAPDTVGEPLRAHAFAKAFHHQW